LKWHMLETADIQNVDDLETEFFKESGLIKEIAPRYRSTYFSHIFNGGYSAGYYSYIWSNIYDADTWVAFKEKGIFNQELAQKYRKHVLEAGGTEKPAKLYLRFRGQEPDPKHLLEARGLDTL
jgi:peptidyl-dipeptidase Dcp